MFIPIDQSQTTKLDPLVTYLENQGIPYHVSEIKSPTFVYLDGKPSPEQVDTLKQVFGLETVFSDHGYLVRKDQKKQTIVQVGDIQIGNGTPVFISGPCSVESESQIMESALQAKKHGAHILRGGAFKPRTSPYSFQGMGKEGIMLLNKAKEVTGLPIISEIMSANELDFFCEHVDILQVGSRNMQNYALLKELGQTNKPIFLKRGLSASIQEFLLSAEYIMAHGNKNVILCERGIRTFETYTRNTMDISAISLLKEMTHLPVFADPSHGCGRRSLIKPLTLASIAAGADGVIIESHPNPDEALSDGAQSIYPQDLNPIIEKSFMIKQIL